MKLDQEGSDQILDAVRTLLPAGVTVYRKGDGNLTMKYKSARFEWHISRFPAFGHISRRNTRADALAIGYEHSLNAITSFLIGIALRWPGLTEGPVEVDVTVNHGSVHATLTDVNGQALTFPVLRAEGQAEHHEPGVDPLPTVTSARPEPMIDNAAMPDAIADRIIAAVTAAMPRDFTIERDRRIVTFRSGGQVLDSVQTVRPTSWPQPFGPRNRDGVTQRSVGWATWMLLDGLLRMSRSRGAPIDKSTAKRLQAYTQVRDGELRSWLAEPGDGIATVNFPVVDLSDLTPEPPKGPRLPVPLLGRYQLPALGEIMTAPGNK